MAPRDHIAVEQHDVVLRVSGREPAVDVGRETAVRLARHHLDAADPPERREMLRAARVVRDHDARRSARGCAPDRPDEPSDMTDVPVAGDHDRHWPPVAPVPAPDGEEVMA